MIKEVNKFKDSPKLAIKFANIIFVLGIICSLLIVTYAIYRIYHPIYLIDSYPLRTKIIKEYHLMFVLFGGVSAILFGLGLKLSNVLKIKLSVLLVTIGISIYVFETYLEFDQLLFKIFHDTRTKSEVLKDFNNSGIEAYPSFFPKLLIESNGIKIKNDKIFPLGTISNVTTVLCDRIADLGHWKIIETDEYGFNNPKALYKKNKVDIVLTGDSFTEGICVDSNETISAILNELGFNAISLGKQNNGPLIELAALKEYAEPLKPKVVLWLYYINDFDELRNEMNSSFLRQYLNKNDFTQDLISRQDEIDSILINIIQERKKIIDKELKKEREREKIASYRSIRILKLYNLRLKAINLIPNFFDMPTPKDAFHKYPSSLEQELGVAFKNILEKSKKLVSGWGGKLYFVYLPPFDRYLTGSEHPFHEFVLNTVTELDISIIDIHTAVFDSHLDPLSLFAPDQHYTSEGYRLVAEAFSKRFKDDNIIQLESNN